MAVKRFEAGALIVAHDAEVTQRPLADAVHAVVRLGARRVCCAGLPQNLSQKGLAGAESAEKVACAGEATSLAARSAHLAQL